MTTYFQFETNGRPVQETPTEAAGALRPNVTVAGTAASLHATPGISLSDATPLRRHPSAMPSSHALRHDRSKENAKMPSNLIDKNTIRDLAWHAAGPDQ